METNLPFVPLWGCGFETPKIETRTGFATAIDPFAREGAETQSGETVHGHLSLRPPNRCSSAKGSSAGENVHQRLTSPCARRLKPLAGFAT